MRGYLIVTETEARYVGEANYLGLREFTSASDNAACRMSRILRRFVGTAPGVYRASDTWVGGRCALKVGPKVDAARESARLLALGAKKAWESHGGGRPGIAGYSEAINAVEHSAKARIARSRLLGEFLAGLGA